MRFSLATEDIILNLSGLLTYTFVIGTIVSIGAYSAMTVANDNAKKESRLEIFHISGYIALVSLILLFFLLYVFFKSALSPQNTE